MSKKNKKVNIKQELHENNIDHVVHEHAGKVIEENQLAYSDLVITGRAIPSQFDGMKPVHRRLFSSFKSNNLINKNIKSARIVGECLVKDTLISTNKGFIPIQNIEVGDQVHTQNGLKNVSALFHQPKQKLLKITLKGGVFINTSTFKHKYKTVNKSGELVFQEAEKFQVGDKLILEASRTDLKSVITEEESLELSHRLSKYGLDNELLEILNLLSIKNLEDFIRGCYIYSLFLPDGRVVDKNKYRDTGYTLIPYKDINLVRQLAYLLFDRLGLYSKLHEDGLLLDNVTHDSKYRLEEIESIEEVAEEETYDFTVDDEHEFFANCVVSSNCIGKLHPHGDIAVYDALIEMTQTFKNRTPLTVGQGNMGSISGDSQAAMRYCVTGDTRIPTAKGMVKIADIVKSKPDSEQDINEVIYSIDGKLNKADKFFNSGKHDIFYLRAENGQEIKGSSNHPLLVLTSDAKGRPFFKWKTLSEIKEGEYLCIDRGLKYDLYSGIKQKNKNEALLAGLLIGATKTDKHYIIDVKEKEKVLKSVGFKINGDKASIKIKNAGSFSNKKISDEIFSMSYKEKATFLRTVFKRLYTDKLILKNKLLRDIQLLLLDFGIVTNVLGKELNFYKEIDRRSFSIRILKIKHKSDDFIELPPYVENFLYENNLELTDDEALDILDLVNNSYSYVKVASIEELPAKDYVYSIRVDNECHSFTANGFVNHNTEIKLPTDSADMLFDNFEKDVFPTVPNYDDTIQEPSLLPVKFPLAILNGTTGVAYAGITSKIPSYNINELRNLYVYIIDNQLYKNHLTPEHREEIMKIIPTVDLPTGCNVYFEDENDSIFSPQFKFRMRATHHFEDDKTITFTKVPTDMTLDRIVEQAKNAGLSYKMVNGKKVNKTEDEILNISENIDIVSRSSFNDNDYKNDAEITFTFKRGSNLNLELIKIYKYTDLDSSYSAKLRFIDENSCPVYLSLYQQSLRFLEFRLHVFYKAYMYDIEKLAHQLHMLYGLVAIYDDLDTFIHIVKNADDSEMYSLIKMKFDLDDSQIEYLLNIQLRKLSKTSVDNIKADIEQKEIKKADLETKIASEDSLYQVIKEDYKNMKFKRAERLTEIIQANRNISKEDMIEDKEVIVMYMEDDTIAYVEKSKFRLKNKGTKTTENKINNDFELNLKITESCRLKDELLLMTNFGRVFRLQAFEFGEQFRFIGNILNLNKDEKLINIMKNESSELYSVITKDGKIKGISGDIFKNTTSNRAITVIKLDDKDSVIGFSPYKEEDMVLLLTDFGRVMKYPATEINVYGGAAKGTRAATLKGKEILIKSFIFKETNESVLIGVSNTGKAKKTLTKKISIKNRTSAPNLFFNNSDENGNLVCGEVLEEDKEVLMLLTQRADVSIIKTSGFSDVSRTAKGSINLIKMQDGEFVKLCKKIELSELSDTQNQIVIEDEESL